MIYQCTNYREVLKAGFTKLAEAQPNLSMRVYASHLGLAASTLHEILNGKKSLSFERAHQIAGKMKLTGEETEYFCLLTQLESVKSDDLKINILTKIAQQNPQFGKRDLSVDRFKTISEWYHFAILAYAELPDVELSPKSISENLGISMIHAEEALARLLRLDILAHGTDGKLTPQHDRFFVESTTPNTGLKQYHEQLLTKAQAAIFDQDPKDRIVASETLSISVEDMPHYDQAIDEFLAKIKAIQTQSQKKKDCVYTIVLEFFRLNKKRNTK